MILGGVHSQFISSHRGDSSSIYCVDETPDECIVVCVCTLHIYNGLFFIHSIELMLNLFFVFIRSLFSPCEDNFRLSSLFFPVILFMLRVCIVCYIETSCCHRLVCAHLLSKGTNQRTRLSRVKKK